MNLFAISGILISVVSSILIVILLIFGKSRLHKIWLLFNLSVLIWGIGTFLLSRSITTSEAWLSWKVATTGGLYLAVLFYHTIYVFCGIDKKKILALIYAQGVTFWLLTIFTPEGVMFAHWHLVYNFFYNSPTILYLLMSCSWVFVSLLGHYELVRFIRKSSGFKHIQGLYLLGGFAVGFIGGGSTLLPAIGIDIYPIGNFGVALYGIIGTYAILRYRLLDVNVAITRAGVFVLVYTLVLGLPFAAVAWFKDRLIELFGANWWGVPLGLMAVLATVGPFIYIFVQRKAEDRLLKEQKQYQRTLKQASIGMTRVRDLKRLLDLIVRIVTKTVHISHAAIYLYDPEKDEYVMQVYRHHGTNAVFRLPAANPLVSWIMVKREPLLYEEVKHQMEDSTNPTYKYLEDNMRLLDASVVIPIFLENKFLGFVILGDKLSGQIYTLDDLDVFQVLASQAALAIENAQFYEDAKVMTEQVAETEKMATVGTMAYGLSHQINNRFYALSLIAGDSIDTIKDIDVSKCTPEIQKMISDVAHALDRIQVNVIQGGEVVKGILKYTKAGEEHFEPLALDQVIDGTIAMVQYKIKLPDIDLVRDYPQDTPKINGNLVQLQEVFFNFIDNAYDSIVERRIMLKEEGYRGKIIFHAKPVGANLEITIIDNGMGMKESNLNKIFTPFFTTKTTNRKGTGLGLYVIKKIITEAHKGKISFESQYQQGTTFTIELPLAK